MTLVVNLVSEQIRRALHTVVVVAYTNDSILALHILSVTSCSFFTHGANCSCCFFNIYPPMADFLLPI